MIGLTRVRASMWMPAAATETGIRILGVMPIEVVDKERAPGLSLGC